MSARGECCEIGYFSHWLKVFEIHCIGTNQSSGTLVPRVAHPTYGWQGFITRKVAQPLETLDVIAYNVIVDSQVFTNSTKWFSFPKVHDWVYF